MIGLLNCIFMAAILFYVAFFRIAPWVCSLIPNGDWQGLISLLVYILVAYFGGIAIPLAFVVLGVMLYLER